MLAGQFWELKSIELQIAKGEKPPLDWSFKAPIASLTFPIESCQRYESASLDPKAHHFPSTRLPPLRLSSPFPTSFRASNSTFPNRTKCYQHAISTARQVQTLGLRLICKIASLLATTQKGTWYTQKVEKYNCNIYLFYYFASGVACKCHQARFGWEKSVPELSQGRNWGKVMSGS